jgi:hypothetical protein
MCKLAAILFFLIVSNGCNASTMVQLPLNGTTTIVGPFPPEPNTAATYLNPAYYVPVQIAINYGPLQLPDVPPLLPTNNQVDFEVYVSASGGEGIYPVSLDINEHNQPGPGGCLNCQYAQASGAFNPGHILILTHDQHQIFTFGGFVNSYGYALVDLEKYFSITATLPDGFSVEAVPEPSIWAMLLIGFAGIGLVTYRRKRKLLLNAL